MTHTPTQAHPSPSRRVAGGDTPHPVTACTLIEIDMDHPQDWQPSQPQKEPVARNMIAAKFAERMAK